MNVEYSGRHLELAQKNVQTPIYSPENVFASLCWKVSHCLKYSLEGKLLFTD